jgi:PAS domain S-box-containing protein
MNTEKKIIGILQGWLELFDGLTLRPPCKVTDVDAAHRQYFLNIVLLGLSIPGTLFGLAMLVMWHLELVPAIAPLIGLGVQPFYALAYGLVRRGYSKLAAWTVVGTIISSVALASAHVGIGHITLIGMTAATALAGILIGLCAALSTALLSGGIYLIVGLVQAAGRLPNPVPPESIVIPEAVGLTLGLFSIALLNWFSRRELRKSATHQQMAESFRQASKRYRVIFDGLDDWVHVMDARLRIVLCNTAMYRTLAQLGVEADVIGQSPTEVFRFLPERVMDEYQQVITSQVPLKTEEQVRLGGQTFIAEVRKIPIVEAEEVAYIITVVRDVTASKRAEAALRESEARFNLFMEHLPGAAFIKDSDNRLIYANRRFAQMTGYKLSDLIGRLTEDYTPPELLARYQAENQLVLAEERILEVESTFPSPQGTSHWLTYKFPIYRADQPPLVGALSLDITKRKQAETALKRYTKRLEIQREIERAILKAHSPQAIAHEALAHLRHIIAYDRAGVAEMDAAQGIVWDLAMVRGSGAPEPLSNRRYPLSNAVNIISAVQKGQPYIQHDLATLSNRNPMEEVLHHAGLRAYLAVPLIAEDELIGVLGLAFRTNDIAQQTIEITQQVADSLAVAMRQAQLYEQIQQDAQVKTALLREVNHRVSNNLTSLVGILSVEARYAREEKNDAVLDVVTRLKGRVEGLATAHQMLSKSQWQPVPLHELAVKVLEGALNVLPPDRTMRFDVTPTPLMVAPRQASNLALIFNELATNTIKYGLTEREEGHIEVQITRNDRWIALTYQDDGPGYAPEVLDGAAHNVGLYLMRQLTRSLRGELHVCNDDGAVTHVRFPAFTCPQ